MRKKGCQNNANGAKWQIALKGIMCGHILIYSCVRASW